MMDGKDIDYIEPDCELTASVVSVTFGCGSTMPCIALEFIRVTDDGNSKPSGILMQIEDAIVVVEQLKHALRMAHRRNN